MAASVSRPPSEVHTPTFRHDLDLSTEQLVGLLELSGEVKRNRQAFASALKGKYAALLFEKPSLRTRLTFELAMKQLGGDSVTQVGMIGEREPLKDVARNLARWTDCIVARTFEQKTIDDLAAWSGIPVVNALSDTYHPCQALADVFTLKEQFGKLKGRKLVYVGDGNNVAHSLMLCGARLGMQCTVATPPGYEPQPAIVEQAVDLAKGSGGAIEITNDPASGCSRGGRRLHGRLGKYGPGGRGQPAQTVVRALSGKHGVDGRCIAPRRLHALSSCQTRLGSNGRSHGIATERCVRPGGKSPARAESSAVDLIAISGKSTRRDVKSEVCLDGRSCSNREDFEDKR